MDNIINVIEKCILLIGVFIDIYIIYGVVIDKIQIKKDKEIKNRSNKYDVIFDLRLYKKFKIENTALV